MLFVQGQRRTQPPTPGVWLPGAYGAQQPLMPLMVPEDAPPGVDPEDMPLLPPPPIQPAPVHAPMRAPPPLAAAPPPRPKLLPEAIGIGPAATDDTDLPPPGLELELAAEANAAGKEDMEEKPMHGVPVALTAEEKRRVERREATQEQRAAAEAERRQRLLAAAAAAVKKSAPAAPAKAAAAGTAAAPRKAPPAPKRDALLKAEAEKKRAREEAAAAEAHARRGAFMELRDARGAPPPPRHHLGSGSGTGDGGDLREGAGGSRERHAHGYSRDREQRPHREAYHGTSPGPPPRAWERRPPPPPPMRPDRARSESPPPRVPHPPRAPPPPRRPVSRERQRPRSSELLASPSPSPRAPPLRRPPADHAHVRPQRPPRRAQAEFRGADENHRRGGYDVGRTVETDRWDGSGDGQPEKPHRGRDVCAERGVRAPLPGHSPKPTERGASKEPIAPEPSESGEIVTSEEEGIGGKEVLSGKRGPDRAAAAAAAERLLRRSPSVSDGDIRSLRKAPTGPRRGSGPQRDAFESGRNGFRW